MINLLGKSMVFLHTLISLVAMTWAVGLFLQFTDWGWKEPRQELDVRIASEFDKSAAALDQAVRVRNLVLPAVAPAEAALADAEAQYPKNHIYYLQEIEKLRGEPLLPGKPSFVEAKGAFEVKDFKNLDEFKGRPAFDNGKITGKPVFDNKIEGLEKPLVAYRADLEKLKEDVTKVQKQIEAVLDETGKITFNLTGMDDTGKKTSGAIGLYDLVDAEYRFMTQARHEFEEIKPIWAQTLEEARLYTLRRAVLEQTLERLKKAAAARR
jgi:hypothetical protein